MFAMDAAHDNFLHRKFIRKFDQILSISFYGLFLEYCK